MMDKAGKQYWNDSWKASEIPNAIDPQQLELNNYVNRRFHEYFFEVFSGMETHGKKLLEIGCATSAWLPYFAEEFGFEVHGVDYSEIGCQKARQILANAHLEGKVVCADFFSPPKAMLDIYDVVVSFGVAEHLKDTTACIKTFSKFLKPNGIMITIIPNMVGLIGLIQKVFNRPVFDIHMALDKDALRTAHEVSGLKVLDCEYFLSCNFGVCNLNGGVTRSVGWIIKKVFLAFVVRLSMMVWFIEARLDTIKPNRIMSSYINCFARKDADTKKKDSEL